MSHEPLLAQARFLGLDPTAVVALIHQPVESWDPWLELPAHLLIGPGCGSLAEVVSDLEQAGIGPAHELTACDPRGRLFDPRQEEPAGWLLLVGPRPPEAGWAERLPLFGKHLVVTRAPEQAGHLVEALEHQGAIVHRFPVLRFVDPPDLEAVYATLKQSFDWVVLTSPNGVDFLIRHLEAAGLDLRSLGSARLAAIGTGTAARLARYHLRADLIPERFVAEGLVEALSQQELAGKRFLLPRAAVARDTLPRELRALGAEVEVLPTYVTLPPDPAPELPPETDLVLFT
ncbi:MAG: uroporphyrinogen-III synthase, partial [Candidatus Eremiobacteraeota bacterium]|nr:uroporphyrinogen-III synthase [Candidatus Eremiobacteraeota bacterium]